MRLKPSQLSWIAASMTLLVAGLVLGNPVMLTGAVFVLFTALLSTTLTPPTDVVVTRSVATATCWIGDTLTVERHLTVRRGIGTVFVYDDLPAEAELVSGSNLRVVWKWRGSLAADLTYQVRFARRGSFTLDETAWEARAPLGVDWTASGCSDAKIVVSAVPRIRSVARLSTLRMPTKQGRFSEDVAKVGETSDEFRELRPYQQGDPFNRINWKASARGVLADDRPFVNDMYPEAKRNVWIFLDTADYMDVGLPLASPLENTVEASGALAQYYLGRGSTLGAYAYNTSDGQGGLLAPESGRSQFRRLVQMLVGLRAGSPHHDLLQAAERCKSFLLRMHPDVFVITRLDVHYDRPGEEREGFERFVTAIERLVTLGAAANRRARVRVVNIAPYVPEEASPGLHWTGWETQVIASEVRNTGASVMEWEPAREEFASVLMQHVKAGF